MGELAQTVTPQGLLAVCDFVDVPLDRVTAARPTLVALLANVRDPGNAGTVLRAADAAGADAVIFADASVDLYNGKCVRASAGSLFHLPVVAGVRLPETIAALGAGLRIFAADGRAGSTLDDPATADGAARRPRGCSATRPGGSPTTCWRWPTSPSRCRSTAGPSRLTSPPRGGVPVRLRPGCSPRAHRPCPVGRARRTPRRPAGPVDR